MSKFTDEFFRNAGIQCKDNAALLLQLHSKISLTAAIIDSTDDAVISKSLDGTIISWNAGSEKMYGYTADEAIGEHYSIIIPDECITQENEFMERIRLNEILHFETLRRKKTGEQFDVFVTEIPIYDCDGGVIGASSVDRDISSHKSLLNELATVNTELEGSKEFFYKIFDCNPVAMMMSNLETSKIQNVNKSFLKLFGYTKEELIGKTAVELNIYGPDDLKKIINVLMEHNNLKAMAVTKKNGTHTWTIASAKLIDLNQTQFILNSFLDISDLKRAEQIVKDTTIQLEQKNAELEKLNAELDLQIKEKEKYANELRISCTGVKELESLVDHKESILAVLSHDLRSPLNGIIGLADHLKSDFDDIERGEMKHIIDLVDESAKKELTMLDNLLEWARIKYASDVFHPEMITLAPYVQYAMDLLSDTAAMNKITFEMEIEANTTVYADSKMLHSILQNVISNAINYSQTEGTITVRAKTTEDTVMIEVKGHHMQLSKTILDNLFSPQLNPISEAKKGNTGAGIGLLLARGFLEKNNGKIWVQSNEGMESSFYFTLPANIRGSVGNKSE